MDHRRSGAGQGVDAFAAIREHPIPALWRMLGLPGEPRFHGSMRSPFREDRHGSFSIFDGGLAWKDHGTGDGGDAVEFLRAALHTDHAGVRSWWLERHGIVPDKPARPSLPPKRIGWPAELLEGTPATWEAFAKRRGMPYPAVQAAVRAGLLRFTLTGGVKCYAVTDARRRNAEIRRCDGKPFATTQRKAYPLKGVDKSWPVGCQLLESAAPGAGVLLVEGATDFLAALGLYCAYRRGGGTQSWVVLALLGASCRTLAPEAAALLLGRHVHLVPDGDDAGDRMAAHWKPLLHGLRCRVGHVKLPRGMDLTDLRMMGEIEPEELFTT